MMLRDELTEIVCPCCDSCYEVSSNKLSELQGQQRTPRRAAREILCPACWHMFMTVMRRFDKRDPVR